MKAFEDKFNEINNDAYRYCEVFLHSASPKQIAQTFWKAALQWALSQRIPLDEEYAKRNNDYTPQPIDPELIEKELEKS